MVAEALQCLKEADTFAAIEFLNQQPGETAVAAAYLELQSALYWQERALDQLPAMSRAGIQYCLDRAESAAARRKMARARALRGQAKRLAYNLGSFTWPGWDEAGLAPTEAQQAEGRDAARLNLRLALELDRDDLVLSRAYWLLGAHLLTSRLYAGALLTFERAAAYAARSGEAQDAALNRVYAALALLLDEPQEGAHRVAFRAALLGLAAYPDGPGLAQQVRTAARVAGYCDVT